VALKKKGKRSVPQNSGVWNYARENPQSRGRKGADCASAVRKKEKTVPDPDEEKKTLGRNLYGKVSKKREMEKSHQMQSRKKTRPSLLPPP